MFPITNVKSPALQGLRHIPGVGKEVARDLRNLGIQSVGDLVGRDPEQLYRQLCELQGVRVDRCMLYVFRCAVYYAESVIHNRPLDPERLKWCYWKDAVDSLNNPS
jgi:nucleotidyltransferase/DNA polymerase involved in DNA repair